MVQAQNAAGEPQVQEGEHDWIFDCLITFLKSPRWKTPVVSYIEEHCLIFDNEEENKLEYTTIHQGFVKIVDELLCELVAEMGISFEFFKAACEASGSSPTNTRIVNQILSVEDFQSFKQMMAKKNMQINEIAMQELMKKSGSAPADDSPQIQAPVAGGGPSQPTATASADAGQLNEDDEQMRLVLEMSRVAAEEEEAKRGQNKEQEDKLAAEEEEMIRLAIEASQAEEERRVSIVRQEEEQIQLAAQASQQLNINPYPSVSQDAAGAAAAQQVEPQQVQPQAARPPPQKIVANIDPEQQRKEDEKLRQLAELKRKREEEKKNPPKPTPAQAPPVQPEPTPVAEPEPQINPKQFLEEQKEVISKIRVPNVEEVSAFDDAYSGFNFRQAEDPYEGKSFAEVLRMKREKLEAQIQTANISNAPVEPVQPAAQAEAQAEPQPAAEPVFDDSLEGRKARLQAQRKALLEKRKQEREKELTEYNANNGGAQLDAARNSFYNQMIKMDQALPKNQQRPIPKPAASAQPAQAQSQAQAQPPAFQQPVAQPPPARGTFNLDDIEGVDI